MWKPRNSPDVQIGRILMEKHSNRQTKEQKMDEVDEQQQRWLGQQQTLVACLADPERGLEALALALRQHAQVHIAAVAETGVFSFEDAVLVGLSDEEIRSRPDGEPNSIAWLLWHCTRIEDVTTNLLIADRPQVWEREGWLTRLRMHAQDVGTGMGDAEVDQVTAEIDLAALRAYRQSVGRSTRQIFQSLPPERLYLPVDPKGIDQLRAAGVLGEGAQHLADIWGSWKLGDLVRQPAIRHSFIHLGEAYDIKRIIMDQA
jgi:hypothetical protein